MTKARNFAVATIIAGLAGFATAVAVHAGGDKIAFPESYGKGVV
jgi:hypothetical protein